MINTLEFLKRHGRTLDIGLYNRFSPLQIKNPLPKDKCIIYYAENKYSRFCQDETYSIMHIDFWDGEKWCHNIDQIHFPESEIDIVPYAYKLIYAIGLGATVKELDWTPLSEK